MDAKALAKSKRAHSLHHKKKHQPHQALKAPSTGSDEKKPTGKQAKERPSQPHSQQANERPPKSHGPRPLPSNWGRYDEDFGLGSEEAQASSSQPTEFVMPKSKGADYTHLISEAKAHSQAHYSLKAVPLLDDFISDFTQDFGPMLVAKGQSILSWMTDDSFEFEDKTNTSFEAPFLSLNLNALAEQLAKAKLSERLYLEPDLLPPELLDNELQACAEGKHDPQTCTSKAETNSTPSSLSYNQEPSKPHREPASSTLSVSGNIPVQTSEEGLKPMKQNVEEILQSQGIEFVTEPPKFEASSVETELDMLLSSFDEVKFPDSSSRASSVGIASTTAALGETTMKVTHMMEPAVIMGSVDDDIDSLLEETSKLTVIDDRLLSKANVETISFTAHPDSKSKHLDDFDSWLDTI